MNKLAGEKSPYLLQHKNNPVNWNPWGEEALSKAREQNKPLFISIGYSTCHWCHVMNRESFNDLEVAQVLNKYFIPIKVDREERPDIDKIYMTFSEAMTGSGGWPLNVFATPEGKPFFLGTYFPKRTKNRITGIIEISERINKLWETEENHILEEANRILVTVKEMFTTYVEGVIHEDISKKAMDSLEDIFDEKNGGFGSRPKFPMPQYIWFLLEYGKDNHDIKALEMAEFTLEKMYKGGIFDHIGHGFYRYSVDKKWLIPHFEKMLYDNALLGIIYAKAYKITDKTLYKEVAENIFSFVIRDMYSEVGGFYSALDAESEGIEGKFYTFTYGEVLDVLGEELGPLYCKYYDITKKGNFEGYNNPNLISVELDDSGKEIISELKKAKDILFKYREKRVRPHRDEKVLTSWNGLMIGSLAYGGRMLKVDSYIQIAKKAANFILESLVDESGGLLSTYVDGEAYNFAFLEDYSFFIFGLIELYKSSGENIYLEVIKDFVENMISHFEDDNGGGLFFYSDLSDKLIMRPKDLYDGAIPSGNSMAVMGLYELYRITGEVKYKERADKIIHSFGGDINDNPLSHLYAIIAYNESLTQ
ncbi:MAG: thioredoxin domain-containing protein [Tissierellaceae bacterium]|nr:thioredoxin domain-containing protein [Tissierellaceae bacterium]